MNMVAEVYKKENLQEETLKLASKLSDKARTTLIVAKKAIRYAEELPMSQGLRFERQLF